MQREPNIPEAYIDIIRAVVVSNETVTDNSQVLTRTKWTIINRVYCIYTGLIVPTHQHQNYYEGVDDSFKFTVLKLFRNIPQATIILMLCRQFSEQN